MLIAFTAQAQNLYRLGSAITEADYMSKTMIIKVKPAFAGICSTDKIDHAGFNAMASAVGVTNLHKKFPRDRSPEKEFNEAGQRFADLSLIYELNYTASIHIEKAISKLLLSGILVYAEPHFIPKVNYAPNDPLANPSDQYHLQRINAFNAWNTNRGDSSIVIGITDTGTDLTHTDLFSNVKRNYADVPDGVDNDGDGYIDNYRGWDVGMNDNDPTWEFNSHGVHVCGISGASADNNLGGAGVGFNCKFLPVKISDASGALVAAYEGIKYAADHGCQAINCSWGGGGASQFGQDIIDYATINKGSLVVAAAGNNGVDGDFFPGSYNYVLAVANTNASDGKSSSSNYGYFVDVCAPGENINSTWPGSFYITQTGTSMSSPVVAGAAGIVKKQFPSYNGLQIGERLKVTADNIYPLNASYLNKLGTGRINLYRAISDPPSPSVVFSDKVFTDHNDDAFISGDTLFITGKFTNYLDATTALNVTVTPLSAYAITLDNTTSLGVINMMASKTNTNDPFSFKLGGTIPVNQSMDFEVLMQDGAYSSRQYFSVFINVDYIDIKINDVYTTATSKGKIGYNQDAQGQGLGFKYKGIDLLYEAGLMIGKDTNTVSDCVRGVNTSISDVDFMNVNRILKTLPAVVSDFDTKASFNDNLSVSPISVEVEQNTLAWSSNPYKQFVIWEYIIKNTNPTDTLKNAYAGIFADWDIDGSSYTQNRSAYHAATKMGYSFYTGANGKYGGIKLLTDTAGPKFYAVDHVGGGNGGLDFSNGIDTKEKYKSMSTQRLAAGASGNGNDVINVMSTGPLTIAPNKSVRIAFAILGADSLGPLITAAMQADTVYNKLKLPPVQANSIAELKDYDVTIFPNPAKNSITISQERNLFTKYELYSVNGVLVSEHKIETAYQTIDLSGFSEGMYLIKLSGAEKSAFKKIVLIK
jgi:subtilisin family serine protease